MDGDPARLCGRVCKGQLDLEGTPVGKACWKVQRYPRSTTLPTLSTINHTITQAYPPPVWSRVHRKSFKHRSTPRLFRGRRAPEPRLRPILPKGSQHGTWKTSRPEERSGAEGSARGNGRWRCFSLSKHQLFFTAKRQTLAGPTKPSSPLRRRRALTRCRPLF